MNTPTVQELLIRIERLEARVLSLEGLTGGFHRLGPSHPLSPTIPGSPEWFVPFCQVVDNPHSFNPLPTSQRPSAVDSLTGEQPRCP